MVQVNGNHIAQCVKKEYQSISDTGFVRREHEGANFIYFLWPDS